MPFQHSPRLLPVLAGALAVAGAILAVAGCSRIAPLNSNPELPSMPPARHLGSPIVVQIMRSKPPTPAGKCPAGAVALYGSDPYVPRAAAASAQPVPVGSVQRSTAAATPAPRPATAPPLLAGDACYLPVGRPVTITSAQVSSVATYRHQPGPAFYGFVVVFPAGDVAALTAVARQAWNSGDATGISVAGKLWQAPQPRHELSALRGAQITLVSRSQAVRLHGLLVPPG
jgi:hypothetical protein